MKQTAVEQLQEYLAISLGPDRMRMLANEFEKAKAMEKEQIIESYCVGCADITKDNSIFPRETSEQYYNETFKPYCMPEGLDTPEKHEQYLKDIGLINNK